MKNPAGSVGRPPGLLVQPNSRVLEEERANDEGGDFATSQVLRRAESKGGTQRTQSIAQKNKDDAVWFFRNSFKSCLKMIAKNSYNNFFAYLV